uniref:Odorant receptor n=1 Tax=Eucryptorrhynchus brandti TaxID=436910 RepID=A0A8F4MZI6_EUCBR|nr:odorant receptor 40 [Eucryptorrhynchus brandti]
MVLDSVYEWAERLFWQGIRKGDILWFIDRDARVLTKNCLFLVLALAVTVYSSIEVACQLYMLTEKPALLHVLAFTPMFFQSTHVLACTVPLIVQRYDYKKIYADYQKMWPLSGVDQKGLEEMRSIFLKCLCTYVGYYFLCFLCIVSFIPVNGVDYERNLWPSLAGFFLINYEMHIMHMCILYNVQCIMLRRRLETIDQRHQQSPVLLLVDDDSYQEHVRRVLKECVKQDIKLKMFGNSLIRHFQWVMLFHAGNGILLLSVLYYMNIFLRGIFSPMGLLIFLFGANSMAFLYAVSSEIFREQVNLIRDAVFETKWYTFNVSNRKTILLLLTNLTRPRFLTAGGVFDVNYALFISIMHKCFNVMTVLNRMMPEGRQMLEN